MVDNTGLENLCVIAGTADEMKKQVRILFQQEFDRTVLKKREDVLLENFSNEKNIRKFMDVLW